MSDLRFIVEKFTREKPFRQSVHLWRPGEEELSDSLWHAEEKKIRGPHSKALDTPTAYFLDGNELYIGTLTGAIDIVDANERLVVDEVKERILLQIQPRLPIEEQRGYAYEIRGFANHEGIMYDASYAGLFKTHDGELIDDRMIHSVRIYGKRLGIVPFGPKVDIMNRRKVFDAPEVQRGHLMDALNKNKSGLNRILKKHYMAFSERQEELKYPGAHYPDWQDFDISRVRQPKDKGVLMSYVSGGTEGILMSFHDSKTDRSVIVSDLEPDKPLLESEGRLVLREL